MMLHILRDKFIRLGRDEEGVAMVVTLAIFMLMYLICMGVYAIGTAVKTRIHLQNACDAAAYSAAVVQADTLSRIATLNRAMSWTYVAMTRRQMDYIVNRWLKHTVSHYEQDRAAALAWWLTSVPPPCPMHSGWNISNIDLNGSHTVTDSEIISAYGGFPGHLLGHQKSFYAASATESGLRLQIAQDKKSIEAMNEAIKIRIDKLPEKEDEAIEGVLAANLDGTPYSHYRHIKQRSDKPRLEYFKELNNNREGEARFCWFGGYWGGKKNLRVTSDGGSDISASYSEDVFEKGIDTWLRRGTRYLDDQGLDDFSFKGIRRSYKIFEKNHKLYSTWTWWSTKSICVLTPKGWVHTPPGIPLTTCAHVVPPSCLMDDHCFSVQTIPGSPLKVKMKSKVHANITALWTDEYEGAECHPYVLTEDYFKKPGTITVGLAVENDNPWASILGSQIQGIFSAFNIGKGMQWTPQYTVCFASAKAGYKYIGEDEDNVKRAYRIDWKDVRWNNQGQSWNLCQSDWDAVLIPVRRAESPALSGEWSDGNMNFLDDYANKLGVDSTEMRAGGDGLDIDSFYGSRNLGEEYRFGNQSGFWGGADLPIKPEPGAVKAKWQIGNPNHPVDWDAMQKVMLH